MSQNSSLVLKDSTSLAQTDLPVKNFIEEEVPTLSKLEVEVKDQRWVLAALDAEIAAGKKELATKEEQRAVAQGKLRVLEAELAKAREEELRSKLLREEKDLEEKLKAVKDKIAGLAPAQKTEATEPASKTVIVKAEEKETPIAIRAKGPVVIPRVAPQEAPMTDMERFGSDIYESLVN